jgi:hypothetical protein
MWHDVLEVTYIRVIPKVIRRKWLIRQKEIPSKKLTIAQEIIHHVWNPKVYYHARFEVLNTVTMKIAVFWDVTPCSLVDIYQFIVRINRRTFRIHTVF